MAGDSRKGPSSRWAPWMIPCPRWMKIEMLMRCDVPYPRQSECRAPSAVNTARRESRRARARRMPPDQKHAECRTPSVECRTESVESRRRSPSAAYRVSRTPSPSEANAARRESRRALSANAARPESRLAPRIARPLRAHLLPLALSSACPARPQLRASRSPSAPRASRSSLRSARIPIIPPHLAPPAHPSAPCRPKSCVVPQSGG